MRRWRLAGDRGSEAATVRKDDTGDIIPVHPSRIE